MKIQQLDKNQHDRNDFDCGKVELNNYLKQTAGQHDKKYLSKTFVLTSEGAPSKIKGYVTLAPIQVNLGELPPQIAKPYPKDPTCALIGRLAVDRRYQRQGFGEILLLDAIQKIVKASEIVPHPMIIVDAKDIPAKEFYMGLGFTPFPNNSMKLYMLTKHAKTMIESLS